MRYCEHGQHEHCNDCLVAARLEDPNYFHGTEYVWCPWTGRRGKWVNQSELSICYKPSDETLEALRALLDRPELRGMETLAACVAEMTRLRGEPVPPTPTHRIRLNELSDWCAMLDAELRRKRAECDELRDRLRKREAR